MRLIEIIEARKIKKIYLDANCFIYIAEENGLFSEHLKPVFASIDNNEFYAATSEISLAECLVKTVALNDANKILVYETALTNSSVLTVLPIYRDVLKKAAWLRANFPALRLPDAIHLASAILTNCDAVLTNDLRLKDNSPIPVLRLQEFV